MQGIAWAGGGLAAGAVASGGAWRLKAGAMLPPTRPVLRTPRAHAGNPDLAPLLGVAWDCGSVTTGPVTVPASAAGSIACQWRSWGWQGLQ